MSETERLFGEIKGYPEGSLFASRDELNKTGVHLQIRAGISGAAEEGAESIVLSGGYEDDDDGDLIIYTGHGGRDQTTGKQVADQKFERGNKALASNKAFGLPVRVIRGATLESPYAPKAGYRYDGLYYVEDLWNDTGRPGYKVWRYILRKQNGKEPGKEGSVIELSGRRPVRVETQFRGWSEIRNSRGTSKGSTTTRARSVEFG